MSDCIFCQIVAGDIPSYTIYEDNDYLAFLDISQIVDGHTLVIPKQHVRWVWEAPDIGAYYQVVGKVAKHFQQTCGDDMVISTVFGEAVPHAHVHLLPQAEGNLDMVLEAWNQALAKRKLDAEKMRQIQEKYRILS